MEQRFFMVKKLVEQQKAINAANTEANTSFDQNPIQWKLAENMIKLLQPFEEATEDINSETSSVALVISTVNSPKSYYRFMKKIWYYHNEEKNIVVNGK